MPIVHIQSKFSFAGTAEAVFRCLSVAAPELRDSENYPGGYYYKGDVGDFKITVYAEDEQDPVFADCQFQVGLTVASTSSMDPEEATGLMIEELLRAGFPVLREKSHTDTEAEVERYAIDASGQPRKRAELRKIG